MNINKISFDGQNRNSFLIRQREITLEKNQDLFLKDEISLPKYVKELKDFFSKQYLYHRRKEAYERNKKTVLQKLETLKDNKFNNIEKIVEIKKSGFINKKLPKISTKIVKEDEEISNPSPKNSTHFNTTSPVYIGLSTFLQQFIDSNKNILNDDNKKKKVFQSKLQNLLEKPVEVKCKLINPPIDAFVKKAKEIEKKPHITKILNENFSKKRSYYFNENIDNDGENTSSSLENRKKTFLKFAFTAVEKYDNQNLEPILNMVNVDEQKGSISVSDFWSQKNIRKFLGTCQLIRDKLILSRISKIRKEKDKFLLDAKKSIISKDNKLDDMFLELELSELIQNDNESISRKEMEILSKSLVGLMLNEAKNEESKQYSRNSGDNLTIESHQDNLCSFQNNKTILEKGQKIINDLDTLGKETKEINKYYYIVIF